MTRSPHRNAPAVYQLRIAERLDQHWSPWFDGLTLTQEDDGTTTLTVVVPDQAALHGLLTRIRDLGVTLISVVIIDPTEPRSAPTDPVNSRSPSAPAVSCHRSPLAKD